MHYAFRDFNIVLENLLMYFSNAHITCSYHLFYPIVYKYGKCYIFFLFLLILIESWLMFMICCHISCPIKFHWFSFVYSTDIKTKGLLLFQSKRLSSVQRKRSETIGDPAEYYQKCLLQTRYTYLYKHNILISMSDSQT